MLAKYHCPALLDESIHANTATERNDEIQTFLKLDDGREVELEEWLDRDATTCQGKTRSMEEDLLSCDNEILQITRDTFF